MRLNANRFLASACGRAANFAGRNILFSEAYFPPYQQVFAALTDIKLHSDLECRREIFKHLPPNPI